MAALETEAGHSVTRWEMIEAEGLCLLLEVYRSLDQIHVERADVYHSSEVSSPMPKRQPMAEIAEALGQWTATSPRQT